MFFDFNMFLEKIINKKIALIGTGISNLSVIDFILKKTKKPLNITILDAKNENELSDDILNLKQYGINFICGKTYLNNLKNFDLIFRSPGVYFNKPELQDAIKHGAIVTSEMELFFELCPCKIVAITGSDGKTTTTSIITKILKTQGFKVHLGGNIGKPLLSKIYEIQPHDIAVVELSSFQLISMRKSPQIGVITNISPNHLDVHKNMNEYIDAKKNILAHQGTFDTAVLNYENEFCRKIINLSRGIVKTFSIKNKVRNGSFFDEKSKKIYYSKNNKQIEILNSDNIALKGKHNIENYLAAISAVFELVEISSIQKIAENFKGVEHRMEFVPSKSDFNWFNDSIATTPTRTIAGLNCFKEKVILIAGGYDKKIAFDKLALKILDKVKVLILTGATANKIEMAVKTANNFEKLPLKIEKVNTMSQAINSAIKNAKLGDNIVLSPACASFDQYENFEQRGLKFKNIVTKLFN